MASWFMKDLQEFVSTISSDTQKWISGEQSESLPTSIHDTPAASPSAQSAPSASAWSAVAAGAQAGQSDDDFSWMADTIPEPAPPASTPPTAQAASEPPTGATSP